MSQEATYERALIRLRDLEKQVTEIKAFLALYRQFSDDSGRPLPGSPDDDQADIGPIQPGIGDGPDSEPLVSQEEFNHLVRTILIENRRPMRRGILLRRFAEWGYPIGGKDPVRTIGTKLWRARNILVLIEGKGYWPKDLPCRIVGYDPAAAEPHTTQAGNGHTDHRHA